MGTSTIPRSYIHGGGDGPSFTEYVGVGCVLLPTYLLAESQAGRLQRGHLGYRDGPCAHCGYSHRPVHTCILNL